MSTTGSRRGCAVDDNAEGPEARRAGSLEKLSAERASRRARAAPVATPRDRPLVPGSTSRSESTSRSPCSASARAAGGSPSQLGERTLERRRGVPSEPGLFAEALPLGGPQHSRRHRRGIARRAILRALAAAARPARSRCAAGRGRQSLPRGFPAASASSSSTRLRSSSSASSSPRRSGARARPLPGAVVGFARRSSIAPRSSCAIARRRRASSPLSFSARSAADACNASGRKRLLTSASTSRARSTWVATRASFSSARWRRALNCRDPRPPRGATRRSAGLEPRISSTLPWPMIECMPPPRPTSASSSTRSIRRTGALLTRYWPSPPRCRRRAIDTSANRKGPGAGLVVEEELDLAVVGRLAVLAPANSTSSGFSALSSSGARLPAAQRIASETFDLPEPFGPTTTATPGSRRTSTGSGNDLKPRSLIARRCTRTKV